MNRRDFLKKTAAGTAVFGASGLIETKSAKAQSGTGRMPRSVLGRTGVKVSRLGVGCGIFIAREFSTAEIHAVLETAVEMGVNYIDTAPNYPGVQNKMGPFVERNRDEIFLVSKVEDPTYQGVWKQLRQTLKELRTDRLDLVHMHSFGDPKRWPDIGSIAAGDGALAALVEAKQKGVIGAIGASGHNNPHRYHALLDTGEIDVLMNVANFVMQHTYGFERKLWHRAREKNIGLVAMKVLGGVHPLTQREFRLSLDDYDDAVRYALSIPGVATAVIGMRDPFEVEEAVNAVCGLAPLSDEEHFALYRKGLDILARQPSLWREAWGPEL